MNALVLGGTRFVGLHLVQLLHSQGQSVTVLNRGQTQGRLPPGVDRILADRADPVQVVAGLKGRQFDAAFDISCYKPSELRPVVDTLEGSVGSYVFCSTVGYYAPGDVAPIREDSPLNPGPRPDKILCEDLLQEMFSQRGFPATIIRPPYIYGPHDHSARRLFSIFAHLARGREVIVPGGGLTLTHTVHVDDVASAFAAVPGKVQALGQVYNAAGPEAITFRGYANAIASIMGVDARIVHVDIRDYEAMLEELGPLRSADLFDYGWRESLVYSTEKLRQQLGWSPRYDIYEGLEVTYRWWLEQGLDKEPWDFSADDLALAWLGSHTRGRT